jgi:hypothetical protein
VGRPGSGESRTVPVEGLLHPPGTAEPALAGSAAAFGAEGWRCYLPELRLELWPQPPDTALPVLPQLTDPEQARALLERSLRGAAPHYADLRLQACTPDVARYKPGSRCTIVYRLEYPPGLAAGRGWPDRVVAKTYHGQDGRDAYAGMRALWDSPLRTSGAVGIAEPLAYLPEHNVLVQGPVRGDQTLKELLPAALGAGTPAALAELEAYVRTAAAGLAALHGCGVAHGETVTWADELAEAREALAKLAIPIPSLAGAAAPLLARLEALAAAHPADPPGPAHRSFRPAQVLLHRGRVGFIDFDGFCRAEPAMDLALFRATLTSIGLSRALWDEHDEGEGGGSIPDRAACLARVAQLEALGEAFLATYQARRPVSRARVALWEALDLLAVLLSSWTKVKPARLNLSMLLLERHLEGLWRAVTS